MVMMENVLFGLYTAGFGCECIIGWKGVSRGLVTSKEFSLRPIEKGHVGQIGIYDDESEN